MKSMEELSQQEKSNNSFSKNNWLRTGMEWAIFMFLFMSLIYPYFAGEVITLRSVLIGLILWPIGGIAFGYSMYLIQGREKKHK